MRSFALLVVLAVAASCSPFQAPAPRQLASPVVGRLNLVPLASWTLPDEKIGILRDSIIVGDHLYALFDDIEATLLKWDLRAPAREAEPLFSRAPLHLWGVSLAPGREGPILACPDPQRLAAIPKGLEAIALSSGKREVYSLEFDEPFFAHDESVPHGFIPHHSRLDLVVGICRDLDPVILTRVKGIRLDSISLARAGEAARVAYTEEEKRLFVVEVDSGGSSRVLEIGEGNVTEPRVLRHQDEWIVTYLQNYRIVGARTGGQERSVAKSLGTQVGNYDVLSTGDQLVILAGGFDRSVTALCLDRAGQWRENRGVPTHLWYLKLFSQTDGIICLGRTGKTQLGLFRLELID